MVSNPVNRKRQSLQVDSSSVCCFD